MADPIVLVDPLCLCGRPHPCDLHRPDAFPAQLNGKLLLRLLDEEDTAVRSRGWDRRRKSA